VSTKDPFLAQSEASHNISRSYPRLTFLCRNILQHHAFHASLSIVQVIIMTRFSLLALAIAALMVTTTQASRTVCNKICLLRQTLHIIRVTKLYLVLSTELVWSRHRTQGWCIIWRQGSRQRQEFPQERLWRRQERSRKRARETES
jgi:hypothetical protein